MTDVVLEIGRTRVFATAPEWPGWTRSGRTEEAALMALADAVPRYAVVAREAHHRFPADIGDEWAVVERIKGDSSTDFGAPNKIAERDRAPLTAAEAGRRVALLRASWVLLDRVVTAAPAELRKGPRGGGRDRDAIRTHVVNAEAMYARKLGVRLPAPDAGHADAVAHLRKAIVDALTGANDGTEVAPKGWPPRYAVARLAWHVLDHAWEIEDKSDTSPR